MKAAMKSVIDKNTPVSRAAKIHGVPKSTLHDRISGKVCHVDKPGPEKLLSLVEEEGFAAKRAEIEAKEAKVGGNREGSKSSRKRHNDNTPLTREKFPKADVAATASSSSVTTAEAEDVCCVCFQVYQGDNKDTDLVQCACH